MRYILLIFVVFPVMSIADRQISEPYSVDVFIGEWASHHTSILKGASFQYLKITEEMNGVLVYGYNGSKANIFRFAANDINQRDGYIEIEIEREDDRSMKLIVSAFRLLSNNGKGRLSGLIFLYQNLSNLELFNTLYLAMDPLESDVDLATKKEIIDARRVSLKATANKSLQPTQ